MKLTKDMLDFEKYDYFAGSTFSGKDPVDVFHAGAWVPPVDGACMYELARALKPKPRYILLHEGEKRLPGDQLLLGHPPATRSCRPRPGKLEWGKPLTKDEYGPVLAGEIWRRKVQE